ncbi:type VI secretion system protein TssA [Roseococcus sp. SYP-B2431]|uniref:type VI secretion system protein TssA n=1 Tax=Roseococcus sp. SYP-B2431 TaxID=2496640 RepID=UPI00103AB1D2|nr:type VI secretion system protein TssA [Roseococcus sp. SYP-B2431]TCH99476.1 type VI secretion system protein TssA [Roseococcus sp. SYP-B2431]
MVDDVVDVATLVEPLGSGDGAGEDLRLDYSPSSIYQKLRDARAEARAEERARDSEGEGETAPVEGWRQVRRLAVDALTSNSKDFEIAAWLTEALVRQEGLAGLSAGARVLAGLLEQHWDAGFPQPDEDGLEGRSAPLGGLAGGDTDGTVMQALRRAPLFRRPSGEGFSIYQYEASADTAGISDETRREQRFAQGVIPLETVETEAKFDRPGLRAMVALTTETRAAWQLFQDQLDARFGYDAPPSRRVAEVLDRMAEVATRLGGGAEDAGGGMVAEDGAPAAPGQPAAAAAAAGGGLVMPGAGSLANREQALKTLEQLAEFFQKTEPHSFLAYTLSDAARRGRMSLPELLAEVMQDEGARTSMLTALGIHPRAMDATE